MFSGELIGLTRAVQVIVDWMRVLEKSNQWWEAKVKHHSPLKEDEQ